MRDVSGPQVGPDSAQAAVQQPPNTVPVVQDGKISDWPGFEAVLHSLLYDKVGAVQQTASLLIPAIMQIAGCAEALHRCSAGPFSCAEGQTRNGISQAVKYAMCWSFWSPVALAGRPGAPAGCICRTRIACSAVWRA